MSNYVLLTIGTEGDVRPFLNLGHALQKRGHTVSLLTHCRYKDQAGRLGLTFIPLDDPAEFEKFIEDGTLINNTQGFMTFFRRHTLPKFQQDYANLYQQCQGKDTIIVARFLSYLSAQAVSEKLGVPMVSVYLTPNEVATLNMLTQVLSATVGTEINQVRSRVNLPPIQDWNGWIRHPGQMLGQWPEWYAPVNANWPQVIPAGFSVTDDANDSEIPEDIQALLANHEKPILITGGTGIFVGSDYYSACVESCRNLKRPGLLVARHAKFVPDNLPKEVTWYPYLPFSRLMPHLGAIIHHGGIGTICQAISAGIPQLILPIGADRPDNAARLQRLGIAEVLPPNRWQSEPIQAALERLLNTPAIHQRCQELARRLNSELDFTVKACAELEKVALHKTPATASINPPVPSATSEKTVVPPPKPELSPERIALMAALLRKKQTQTKENQSPLFNLVMDPDHRDVPFDLTDVQQAYWIGRNAVFELGGVATHGYMEFDCAGVDLPRLNQAWQRLIQRHEMLHAIILPSGRQQILTEIPQYTIEVLDLQGQDAQVITTHLETIREQLSHQVLPVDCWPPFEIRATRFDDQHLRLHVSFDVLFTDGWSVWIILQELYQLYQDTAVSLPSLELSFRDYVLAEKEFQNSPAYGRSLEYWRNRLDTLPPAPELPLINNPATLSKPRFVRRNAKLEPEVWQRLKERAGKAGLTPTIVALTAFADILAAWSKNPRFTINLTLFNRMPFHPQAKTIIGDFTSLTLLAVDQSMSDSFELRARRLRDQLWQDLDHRYVSGVRVLRELARRQGEGLQALMPVVFTSTMNLPANLGGASLEWLGKFVYGISQTPQVWLDNQVTEENGTLEFNWDAVEDIFPPGMLDDMFSAYCQLLTRLGEAESAWPDKTFSLIPEAQLVQRNQVNDTIFPVANELLHSLFEEQVARRPLWAAVISPSDSLTYQDLARRSRRIGRWLQEKGVKPNQLVAVVMEKGWEQVAAVMGILYSGGAYLPIDPALPKERQWYLLEQGEVGIALTQSRLINQLEWPGSITPVAVDNDEFWGTLSDAPMEIVQKPTDLAYVIYTSGSTGLPKGVMIDHRGAVNTILDINRRFQVTPRDRALALSALNFDLSVYDIFGMLAAGGTIVMPEPGTHRDPKVWLDYVESLGVTVWNTVPTLMEMLVEYSVSQPQVDLSGLRLVMMSGDWIPTTLPGRIRQLSPNTQIYSLGGATEASIWSILYPIEQVDPAWPSIPYGKPMVNQTFHVLNHHLKPCPIWVPGELYIGGTGLALGYWHDDQKTAGKFINLPRTGERLYKTGDLGRYLPDGNIEFLGREDFQVKIRGHRIELGEIEAALLQHPNIRNAVVTAMGDSGTKRSAHKNLQLVAYVVPENPSPEDNPTTTNDFRSFLQTKLPSYMVPQLFEILNELPLTSNGKVDRKMLPKPLGLKTPKDSGLPVTQISSTELQQTLAVIWKEMLEIDSCGTHDNFFDLGGNSVQVIRVHTKLQEQLGKEIAISKLFEYPTIDSLAAYIEQEGQGKPSVLLQTGEAAQNRKLLMQQQQMRRQKIEQKVIIGE